jgi:UDP-N-acetyl-D-mannosaminuronate dehydrogenase
VFEAVGMRLESVPLEPGAYDAVVVATAHSGIDWTSIVREASLVVDFRNATGKAGIESEKVWKL